MKVATTRQVRVIQVNWTGRIDTPEKMLNNLRCDHAVFARLASAGVLFDVVLAYPSVRERIYRAFPASPGHVWNTN